MNYSVAIILLNYNNYHDTYECINSITAIDYKNYFIVLVDNCSTDSSYEELKATFNDDHKIHLMKSKKNGGFSYGNNIGIKYALNKKADYILLLNNDTTVEQDFLSELLYSAINQNADLTTPMILYHSDKSKIWYGGGHFGKYPVRAVHEGINQKIENYEIRNDRNVTFASGCCILIKTTAFEKTGLLPEEYFMYCEDLDYCLKAKFCGLKIILSSKATIYHKVSSSSGGEESEYALRYTVKNHKQLLKKYIHSKHLNQFQMLTLYTFYIYKSAQYFLKRKTKASMTILNTLFGLMVS